MKYILLLSVLLLVLPVAVYPTAIVKNTGTTSEDSVCLFVNCMDSSGNMTTCDSFYVRVVKSNANAVIFSDSGTCAGMAALDSVSGKSQYYYHNLVSAIDGAGDAGQYTLIVIGRKTTSSNLYTPNALTFQISPKIYALTDTTNAILDTLQLYDNASRFPLKQTDTVNMAGQYTKIRDSVYATAIRDTVNALIDSVQNGSSTLRAVTTVNYDTVNAILDTLQLYDGRWGLEASITALRDSMSIIIPQIDTLGFITGYKLGAVSHLGRSADADTLHIYNGTEEKWKLILYHVGGATGDTPDSSKVVSGP